MKDMPTVTPCNAQAWMIRISGGISLVLNTWFVQVITANGTCVCADGPRPHSYCVPFLDFKTLAKLVFALHKVNQNCGLMASTSSTGTQCNSIDIYLLFIVVLLLHLDIHGFCLVCHGVISTVRAKSLPAVDTDQKPYVSLQHID